jgi:hypothetical protein
MILSGAVLARNAPGVWLRLSASAVGDSGVVGRRDRLAWWAWIRRVRLGRFCTTVTGRSLWLSRDRSASTVRCKWLVNSRCSPSLTTRPRRPTLPRSARERLRVRACDGDQELADAIDAARGIASSEATPLEQLAVDLEQLADLIDGGPESAGGRLDLTTGEVWSEFAFEDTFEEEEDDAPDRWLHVLPTGSRRAYDDMVDFTATRADQRLRETTRSRAGRPWGVPPVQGSPVRPAR